MNATPDSSAILVVDDHRALRLSVVNWLEFRFPGCAVYGAESGEEALDRVGAIRPDVVLMDINLPGIDGIEAARRIKYLAPKTAVVMLTSHDTPHHRLAAAKAGAAAYVVKRDIDRKLQPTVEAFLCARRSGGGK